MRRLVLAVLAYGQCDHPAIYRDSEGNTRCTECHAILS